MQCVTDRLKRVGPAGNKGEEVWEVKSKVAITKFIVSHEPQKINSLQLQYVDEDGNFTMSEIFGNSEFVGTGFLAVLLLYLPSISLLTSYASYIL